MSDASATPPTATPPTVIGRRALLALGAAAALSACSTPAQPSADGTPITPTARPTTTPTGRPSVSSSGTPTAVATSSTPPGGPAVEVVHGPRSVAAVALTFHGAGDPALAHQVLDEAEKARAAVTIMAVGTWLQANAGIADRILSGGHELGNHTLHHLPMRRMDAASAYAEIMGGLDEVRRFSANATWFRPSGTPHATTAILQAAGRAGYRTSLSFDVDPADYTDPGASVVVARVMAAVRPGSIVSLHLGHSGTVAALPRILDGLAGRGLRPVTVTDLLPGVSP